MPTEAIDRPASSRQLASIKRLHADLGEDGQTVSGEMSSVEASRLIGELLARARQNGPGNSHGQRVKINEPRLGMAMKECFRIWKKNGWLIYTEHRKAFIRDVIRTYNLFAEIAEEVGQNGSVSDK